MFSHVFWKGNHKKRAKGEMGFKAGKWYLSEVYTYHSNKLQKALLLMPICYHH